MFKHNFEILKININMNTTPMELFVVGQVYNATAYGVADAKIGMHIAAHYYVTTGGTTIEYFDPATPPYTVIVKVNGNYYRTVTDIPAAVNPADFSEYNCIIENLPPGTYSLIISDSTQPEPLDCRAISAFNAVSPPYATLNGTVNAFGFQTIVSFEYGTTASYGNVAEFGMVNGVQPTACTLNLSSGGYNNTTILVPGTTYHFRIKAVNINGTSYGEDMTFTTPPALPYAVTLPATNVGNTPPQ